MNYLLKSYGKLVLVKICYIYHFITFSFLCHLAAHSWRLGVRFLQLIHYGVNSVYLQNHFLVCLTTHC